MLSLYEHHEFNWVLTNLLTSDTICARVGTDHRAEAKRLGACFVGRCRFKEMHLQPFSGLCVGWISGEAVSETRASIERTAREKRTRSSFFSPWSAPLYVRWFPNGHASCRYVVALFLFHANGGEMWEQAAGLDGRGDEQASTDGSDQTCQWCVSVHGAPSFYP